MGKTIKVIIDIRSLRISQTGAKTYLEEIIRELQKTKTGFTFHFADTILPVKNGNNTLLKSLEHIRFFLWKQVTLPLICIFRRADLLYCTDYFLPLFSPGFKTAVVFYDAFFWESPEQYNRIWLKLLKYTGVPAAKKADVVITISEHSRQQIIKNVGIHPGRIHVIHIAPKTSTKRNNIISDITSSTTRYILHVGVLEKRKNLTNLIRAFHLLLQDGFTEYKLVLVGNTILKESLDDSANIHALIHELGLEQDVILPGFIRDEELAFYYRNASAYTFVSLNEGFGIPVLEAFQNNVPTVISGNSCLPEIGGDAVLICEPLDPADIKEKIKMILTNPALQKELIEKGQKRLALFSWRNTTDKLLAVFKSLF